MRVASRLTLKICRRVCLFVCLFTLCSGGSTGEVGRECVQEAYYHGVRTSEWARAISDLEVSGVFHTQHDAGIPCFSRRAPPFWIAWLQKHGIAKKKLVTQEDDEIDALVLLKGDPDGQEVLLALLQWNESMTRRFAIVGLRRIFGNTGRKIDPKPFGAVLSDRDKVIPEEATNLVAAMARSGSKKTQTKR